MPAHAMHFRNPRRSTPSWLWSNKIASWFFCSGIFSFPFFPNKVRSRFTVQNRRHTLLFHGNLFWRCGNKTIVRWFVRMQPGLHRSLHMVRPAALAFGTGASQRIFVTPPNSLHPPARQRRSPRTIHRSPDRPPNPQYPPAGRACRWDAQRFFLAGPQRDREPGQ